MLGFRHSRRVGETQIRGRLRVRAACSACGCCQSDSGGNEIPARGMNGLIGHDVFHDRYKRVKLTRTERSATFVRSGRAWAMCAATTNGSVFQGPQPEVLRISRGVYYLGGAAPAGHSAGVTGTGDARVVAPRAARRWVAQVALLGARRRADAEASK
jgi:hypothetical protein